MASALFSVLVNGSPTGFFSSLKGLRQGGPLVFTMVLEVLSRMIKKAEMRYILGFRVGSSDVIISHLQFADNTMIFCDADVRQLGYFRCLLSCFETVLGLKISLFKSELFQVGEEYNIESLAWVLGCKIGYLPLSYLCLPIGASFKSKGIWEPIVDRISIRLEG